MSSNINGFTNNSSDQALFIQSFDTVEQTEILNDRSNKNQNAKVSNNKSSGFNVPGYIEIKTSKNEDPKELHRRYLMEAASEAGLDGTEQQQKFVKKYLGGMKFADKSADPSPDDKDLSVKSTDLKNEWKTYELSPEEIADLKRLQKEFKAEGGILKRGNTYENTATGEAFSMARRGDTVRRPLTETQYQAIRARQLWEQAQIIESSPFGTPAKLQDLKHISIDVPADATAEQTDSILSAYIAQRYGDRSNIYGKDRADILSFAKANGVKIENVSVSDGKAEFDISVESLLKLHIAYIGVQEKANILEAKLDKQQWDSAYNQFLVGVGEGAWNSLKDAGAILSDPIGAVQGLYEGAKTAGLLALELVNMPVGERNALFAQLAIAGVKGLGDMELKDAARHIGNFIGGLAVDAALGKGIGTAVKALNVLGFGRKIISETVALSKKVKQSLGKVKVPLSDMKVVSDTMGNKWWIREGELKKLEDIIKPMESRAKETLSGVKKAINLPAWNKLTFKLENDGKTIHFLNNHTVTGRGYLQSTTMGGRKDVFPANMSEKQIFKVVREAYESSKKVGTQIDDKTGDKIVELVGHSKDGMEIRMYINVTKKQLDTAFPQ